MTIDQIRDDQLHAFARTFPGGPLGQYALELALRFGMRADPREEDGRHAVFLWHQGQRAGAIWTDGAYDWRSTTGLVDDLAGNGHPHVGLVPVYRHLAEAAGLGDERDDLDRTLQVEDHAEDGDQLHGDDRLTCYACQDWSSPTHRHHPVTGLFLRP